MKSANTPPFIEHMVRIGSFAEANEILRNPDFGSGRFEEESLPFRGRTLLEVDGPEHRGRRQMERVLVTRQMLDLYDDEIIEPVIERSVRAAEGGRGDDGIVRADLADLSHRMFIQVAAAVIGLDDVNSPERTALLESCMYKLNTAFDVKFSTREHAEVIAEGLEAKEVFRDSFFAPSYERRRAMLEAGEDVPTDLLVVLLRHHGEDWDDDLQVREAILYMAGATDTTSNAVNHAVAEMDRWLAEHPEDLGRKTDPAFLRGVCNEALRLHQNVTALARRANVDTTLSSGREFKAGDQVALDFVEANMDPEVFGEDAEIFNPWRDPPTFQGARPYGLAFGMGRHLCMGLPLVTPIAGRPSGDDEDERALARIVRALVDAGVELDPDRPPTFAATAEDVYATLPILLRAL
ncbi:MAG: cytochrome P450 [Actinobacteria bacterium]|nr:cytochrome P450 [Actinomycetota bacterium]